MPSRLAPTLAAWKRLVDVFSAKRLHVLCWHAVQHAEVTLAQPPVMQHWDVRARECHLSGLNRATQIGCEDRIQVVATATFAKLPCEGTAAR